MIRFNYFIPFKGLTVYFWLHHNSKSRLVWRVHFIVLHLMALYYFSHVYGFKVFPMCNDCLYFKRFSWTLSIVKEAIQLLIKLFIGGIFPIFRLFLALKKGVFWRKCVLWSCIGIISFVMLPLFYPNFLLFHRTERGLIFCYHSFSAEL